MKRSPERVWRRLLRGKETAVISRRFSLFAIGFGFTFVVLAALPAMAQYEAQGPSGERFPWPEGVRCAVSLTFDDGRVSQIDNGIAVLNEYDVNATFYVTPMNVRHRLGGWKAAIDAGHEVGNHTRSHPCTGNFAFSRRNPLEDYDLERISDDIDEAQMYLNETLDINATSFAYPCGQSFVGRGENLKSYIPVIARKFVSGRTWMSETPNDPWICDLAQLTAMESDAKTFEELKVLLVQAAVEGRWLILAGHDIGEDGHQTTTISSLRQLLEYARHPDSGIWIDTVGTIAEYVHDKRQTMQSEE